jgi:hypothetical protein
MTPIEKSAASFLEALTIAMTSGCIDAAEWERRLRGSMALLDVTDRRVRKMHLDFVSGSLSAQDYRIDSEKAMWFAASTIDSDVRVMLDEILAHLAVQRGEYGN